MKRILLASFALIMIVSAGAQDKTAGDYKKEGIESYNAKDYAKALGSFEKAIELYKAENKLDTNLYYNAAICAFNQKDFAKADLYFTESINLDFKTCSAYLYKAKALAKQDKRSDLETTCAKGSELCADNKTKFNDVLFDFYSKAGLKVYNSGSKIQTNANQFQKSDPAKFKTESEKAKAEFTKSLPDLEKAYSLDKTDANLNKALKAAYEILDMKDKAAAIK